MFCLIEIQELMVIDGVCQPPKCTAKKEILHKQLAGKQLWATNINFIDISQSADDFATATGFVVIQGQVEDFSPKFQD